MGVPFAGTPGPFNAITDVAGVAVGYTTLVEGDGDLVVGKGPIRTGVTAILPRGTQDITTPVFAGHHSLNGCGDMSGLLWAEESGEYFGPITITNSHSCGLSRDASIRWVARNLPPDKPAWQLPMPVAAETYDGELNDINGFHVTEEHVFSAIEAARSGPLELGSVGGGTGMTAFEFKAGSGSSSRIIEIQGATYTLGIFVQANFGLRPELVIAGIPVGEDLRGGEWRSNRPASAISGSSIVVIVATDAPLLPRQLTRLGKRVSLGLARTGSVAHNSSGDIFFAFSTANATSFAERLATQTVSFLSNDFIDPLFTAVVQATEEAIVDSLVVNSPMSGANGHTVLALPHRELQELLRRHGRLNEAVVASGHGGGQL